MRPETEAELAEIVTGLSDPVRIAGGGTRGVGGSDPVLSVAGLQGITLYEPGALTVVARSGTPLAEIEATLEAEGQQLAFEPMDHRGLLGTMGEPTIGGVVAANISGPRRIQTGACRDFLLGVRYIDGRGQVIKNGGRVMKNVTGYDLVKLMAGSWGTLGVLSEVSLKVLPKPEAQATLALDVPDARAAVGVMSAALKSPYEVSGAAYDPAQNQAFLRIEGFADSVAYRIDRLRETLGGGADRSDMCWADIRDARAFHDLEGDLWRLSVKPGDAPDIAARAGAERLLFDWGGGLIWALMPKGTDLRPRLGDFEGHATLVRADEGTMDKLGRFQPESALIQALTKGIRQRFDPRGVFNPGLMG
ncbi:glycolate oxidase, GlcE subunit [Rhodobacteraceae bacterium KLH11]|nr:glycolate oxidase, GlcE subunit [Rhodobacteraceae bacterium KLH11]